MRPGQVEAVPPGTVERVKNASNNRAAPAENLTGAFFRLRTRKDLRYFRWDETLRAITTSVRSDAIKSKKKETDLRVPAAVRQTIETDNVI